MQICSLRYGFIHSSLFAYDWLKWAVFLCFFETQPALPLFIRQNENRICQLAGANSKWKLQLTSSKLSMNIHWRVLINEYPVWLWSLTGSVWHEWDWHIYRNCSAFTPPNQYTLKLWAKLCDNAYTSIRHLRIPQTQSQSERHCHTVIILFLKSHVMHDSPFSNRLLQA